VTIQTRNLSKVARIAALLLIAPWAGVPACAETILFVGNSFTVGALSPVQHYRPETVTDLNHEGTGGVPALFKTFTGQAGLHYEVSLEAAGGTNLDFHYTQKAALITRPWDHVVLQPYSTLDEGDPGNATKVIDFSARLAQVFQAQNPRVDVRLVATWSRADQTYLPSGHWFGKPIDRMAIDVRAACDSAARHSPLIAAVIPVGQAWTRAIEGAIAVRNPLLPVPAGQIDLWAPDNYHASSYGYYLEALVVYGSVTGNDPRTLGDKETAASDLGMTPAEAHALQQTAFETLAAEARAPDERPSNTGR
jgi:putative endopeptidase